MNKFKTKKRHVAVALFLLFSFLAIPAKALHADGFGRISQGFFFEYHTIENNRYYINGNITDEFLTGSNKGYQRFTEIYSLRSRTLYHHRYVALLFDYLYSSTQLLLYNNIGIEDKTVRKKRESHGFSPQLYFTYAPLRVGIAYSYTMFKGSVQQEEQLVSLKPSQAFSSLLELYFAKLGKSPLGISFFYEFAFDPQLQISEIPDNFYHKAGLSLHLYFNYYNQFKLVFYQQYYKKKASYLKYEGENESGETQYAAYKHENITRYYLDYIFTYKLTDNVSLKMSMGQLVYSRYESPALSFSAGIVLHYGKVY